MCRLGIIFLLSAIFSLNFELCLCACARAEYEIEGKCCLMCAPGNRVYRHCTEFTRTSCVPCVGATFLDAPNDFIACFSCAACDPGQGLRVKTACTRSSDTVCEPLDKYYCTDKKRDSCLQAVKHTTCSPGHYIKQEGTALKDTECAECTGGSYSNGSLYFCQPHSKCEDQGLVEIKPGTHSSDAECGNKTSSSVTAGVTVLIISLTVAAVAVFMFLRKKTQDCPKFMPDQVASRLIRMQDCGNSQMNHAGGEEQIIHSVGLIETPNRLRENMPGL